jgi:hypothetical protein
MDIFLTPELQASIPRQYLRALGSALLDDDELRAEIRERRGTRAYDED